MKVVIIIGAGGGMGKAVCKHLLRNNMAVVGCDLSLEQMTDIQHDNLDPQIVNLEDESQITQLFTHVKRTFGRVDGLVNIAGIPQSSKPIDKVTTQLWEKMMTVNATSVFLTCREAVRLMKQNNSGFIINTGTVSVARPRSGLQSYIASKGAVEVFSRALALETAPYNIRVNVLHPGPAETDMLEKCTTKEDQINGLNLDTFKQSVPLGQLIQPDDIAHMVNFLLSDYARLMTGAVIHVDGGRSL